MAETLPIPPKLAETFFEAVRAYVRWPFATPEPTVNVDQDDPVPISTICRRVDMFTDPLPDEVFEALHFLATDETRRHLREKLGAGSYVVASRIQTSAKSGDRRAPQSIAITFAALFLSTIGAEAEGTWCAQYCSPGGIGVGGKVNEGPGAAPKS